MVLLFENKKKEKGYVFKFEAKKCIGYEPEFIVQQIIEPMLPKLMEV